MNTWKRQIARLANPAVASHNGPRRQLILHPNVQLRARNLLESSQQVTANAVQYSSSDRLMPEEDYNYLVLPRMKANS